ncbi:MAG: glycosyltransferase family 4 protein, partial [Thermoplasmata archaeon]
VEARVSQRVGKGPVSLIVKAWILATMKLMLRSCAHVFVVSFDSRSTRANFLQQEFGLNSSRVSLEPHPALLQNVTERIPRELEPLRELPFVSCPGFFRKEKGFDLAVEAWSKLPSEMSGLRLVIVGPAITHDGKGYLDEVKGRCAKFDLRDRVLLVPRFLRGSELLWVLRHSRLVLLPYLHNSGTSGVAVDALACGAKVLATASGVMGESFSHPNLAFTESTPEGIASSVRRLLSTEGSATAVPNPDPAKTAPGFERVTDIALDQYLRLDKWWTR